MVGIAVEEYAAREGAEGIAHTAAFLSFKEVAVPHFATGINEIRAFDMFGFANVTNEVARNDDLVEKIPLSFVCERADSFFFEFVPEGIVESVFDGFFFIADSTEHLRA